jgi:hypothetical protein
MSGNNEDYCKWFDKITEGSNGTLPGTGYSEDRFISNYRNSHYNDRDDNNFKKSSTERLYTKKSSNNKTKKTNK